MKIPGLSFSLKRAIGISAIMQMFARTTGVPLTRQGVERKVGRRVIKSLTNKKH